MKIVKWKKVKSEIEYKGKRVIVSNDHFVLPNGNVTEYSIVMKGPVVAVLAITSDNKIILVEQFRPAVNEITLDLPGGGVNTRENETPLAAAKRELKEETGYSAENFSQLCNFFYPDSGRTNQKRYIYVATNLIKGEPMTEDNELIKIHEVSIKDVLKKIKIGKYNEVTLSLALLLWNFQNLYFNKNS